MQQNCKNEYKIILLTATFILGVFVMKPLTGRLIPETSEPHIFIPRMILQRGANCSISFSPFQIFKYRFFFLLLLSAMMVSALESSLGYFFSFLRFFYRYCLAFLFIFAVYLHRIYFIRRDTMHQC